jgi:hypothetical protein
MCKMDVVAGQVEEDLPVILKRIGHLNKNNGATNRLLSAKACKTKMGKDPTLLNDRKSCNYYICKALQDKQLLFFKEEWFSFLGK